MRIWFCAALVIAGASVNCGRGDAETAIVDAGSASEQPDGGTASEHPDGGVVPQAQCAGLGPGIVGQPSASVALRRSSYENWTARPSDQAGNVALIATNDNAEPSLQVRVFDPSGVQRGMYQPPAVTLTETLVAQSRGFVTTWADYARNRGEIVALDGNGSVIATLEMSGTTASRAATDPTGGSVVLVGRMDGKAPIEVVAYDERLKLRFRTQLPSDERPFELAVDRAGNTLVVSTTDRYGKGSVGGIWIDHSGHAKQEFLLVDSLAIGTGLYLSPRIGSGFFVRRGADWILQLDSMDTGRAPPDWLAKRPDTTLQVVRNGRAYGLVHPARADATCHVDVEVVEPSGASCGTAAFPGHVRGDFCEGYPIIGYDGTVIDATVEASGDGYQTSTFRWWSGFLR